MDLQASLQRMPGAGGQVSEQRRDLVVTAIERVLEAERGAEAQLLDSRQQAETLVGAAREHAAAIARRVDARISKLHTAYLQKIDSNIAELPSSPSAGVGGDVALDDSDLVHAAHRLAARLAGDP